MKKTALISTIGLALVSASITASANQTLDDRVGIRFGPFFPSIETSVTISNQTQEYEDFLDDSATTGAVDVAWRISKPFRADFNYWAVNRDDTTSLCQFAVIPRPDRSRLFDGPIKRFRALHGRRLKKS